MRISHVKPISVRALRDASRCSGGIWQDIAAKTVYHELSRRRIARQIGQVDSSLV